ncbi:MAG: hypothetical protein ACH36H_06885 [Candidatus Nanopelagicales bacterium]
MRQLLDATPSWLLIIICFAIFAAICTISRWLVRRRTSDERREEVADYASSLVSGLAATFAFLVGFAITMTWGAVNAGQDAVDSLAASSQQLSWSSSNIADQAGAAEIKSRLTAYLNAFVTDDAEALAQGNVSPLPTAVPFDKLQDAVHSVAYRGGDSIPEASGMVNAAAALTAAQSKVTAVAQRSLPPLLIVLILLAGALLAVGMGTAAATVERPTLMYGWAFLSGLSLTMVLMLDYPFGGAISVNLAPVAQVAQAVAG